jgi:AcrR family transcriptional regulator
MYYYFDDKQDLYVTTLQDAVKRLIIDAGSVEEAKDAEGFWLAVELWCERSLRLFRADPAAVGLMRNFMKSVERGEGSAALSELRRMGRLCMRAFIASGRAVSAIRDDLPEELLTSILMSLEEGIDVWLAEHEADFDDDQLAELARLMASLYRRVAAPEETTMKTTAPRKSAAARRGKGRVR